MRITDVVTFTCFANWRNYVFVKVTTDRGIVGWGEATLEGRELTVCAAVAELKRYLVGQDPLQIEQHTQEMYRRPFWVGGPVLGSALSGVEHALWDIFGKAANLPVWQLLGGKCRDEIRCYANGWSGGARRPSDFARAAERTVKRGFDALKWDPFGAAGLFIDNDEADNAVACVRAVRDAVGPKVDLLIEVHGRLSPANAIRLGHDLTPYRPFFYEEPVPPENVDAMKKVSEAIAIPVATGERLFTKWGFKDLLEKQAADIIQPDPCHDGGILETKKIAAMAEVHYVGVAPHNPNGPIGSAVCLHLDANLPNFLIQEMLIDDVPWSDEIVREPLEFVNGRIAVNDRPGLGVEVNEEAILAHPYQPVDMNQYAPGRRLLSD